MTDFDNVDSTRFMPKVRVCPKCGTRMDSSGKIIANSFVTIYHCPKCNYSETVKT